jgi:CRISPR-associated protein Csx3
MKLFPAVFIGGPPHSGKSVLTYSLTQALRRRGVEHYVLRACPDGEGDWANEADQALVRTIRVKGDFTPEFVDHMCRDLARRHLPLLVDVGGKPTEWQEPIFAHCTHAILLVKDEAARREWRGRAERHALPILAEITSQLAGHDVLSDAGLVLRGTMTGLERGRTATGPIFDALVERLAAIFAYDPAELRTIHRSLAPVETVVELDRLVRTFDVPVEGERALWEPHHLPQVLDYLPEGVPLGLYGRGPNWLYAALALHVAPAPLYQFDVRLGWITPPVLHLGTPDLHAPLQVRGYERPDHMRMEFTLPQAYVDYREAQELRVPLAPAGPSTALRHGSGQGSGQASGLVLSGKLPLWLWTALALTYAKQVPWLAVYQPQWGDRAVVISSLVPAAAIGTLVLSPPA